MDAVIGDVTLLGLAAGSLEEVTPSVALLSAGFGVLVLLGDFGVFVGVLMGDLLVVVVEVVSTLGGFLLSWRLLHELAVIPADKDHFPGETVPSPPAAHQEPRGHTHICNLLLPL
ncbi:hypothetical protein F7725_023828, partial [Dissostichus mawsoni]